MFVAPLGAALGMVGVALAQDEAAGGWGDVEAAAPPKTFETRVYGFIDTHVEAVAKTPSRADDGSTAWNSNPVEIDIPNLHLMVQGKVRGKYKYFLNLAAPGAGGVIDDEPLVVRNAWVEIPLRGDLLQLRAGKTYRRFGLYNEILDAVPTFFGIEPPEMFDKDHLLLTRTTNLMLHGSVPIRSVNLQYAVTTGQDERIGASIPFGLDVRADIGGHLLVGSSFYSTGGPAAPGRAVGDGSPRGGVVNWMAEDQYVVYGGFAQVNAGGLQVQAEYWQADHDAVRDEASVVALADAGLTPGQLDRYFEGGDPANGVTKPAVSYTVRTGYLRAGYDVPLGHAASITPYVQGDWYANPEVVQEKDVGGDDEAGLTDDGQFLKYTVGTVIRPVPEVALKVDGSAHQFQFNGETVVFPEIRFSLSYLWDLGQ